MQRDPSLDALLGLDGQVYVISDEAGLWVRFVVQRVPPSPGRPHGLNYSMTLHDRHGERILGFDNAHPVSSRSGPASQMEQTYDHKHRQDTVRPYSYQDAAILLGDFWQEVEAFCHEKGVKI